MEEYWQFMKTLRSQMNDVEDQAAKFLLEEQMHITTIQTLEKDLSFAKGETENFKEDVDRLMKAKGQLCSQMLEKQRKISSLESVSSALSQTSELIQQERDSLFAKLTVKSSYYAKVEEDIRAKLQQRQAWFDTNKAGREMGEQGLNDKERKNLMGMLVSAKAKLEGITQLKSDLQSKTKKMKQSVEHLRCKENEFKPELVSMDIKTLEDEYNAILSDKTGETEYLHSLQSQNEKLKGISLVIRCTCGEEYQI